jgi:hypothetical protein
LAPTVEAVPTAGVAVAVPVVVVDRVLGFRRLAHDRFSFDPGDAIHALICSSTSIGV